MDTDNMHVRGVCGAAASRACVKGAQANMSVLVLDGVKHFMVLILAVVHMLPYARAPQVPRAFD